jgi:two-component system CheB/CheR fusion protein
MPVVEARNQMQIEPDHVYVIPPGRDLAVMRGMLHLLEPSEPRGLRLPIDFLFKSLADDRQQKSIGVILSGMGSDGTLGLRAIRQAAGACFVQTPAQAQFDSMPRSAIDAGVAGVVAPADQLPGKILAYVDRIQLGAHADTEGEVEPEDVASLDKAIDLLRAQTRHDFSLYKKSTISRRIERRMGLHQLARIGDYLRYLRENPQESELLFNELLIGVTSFFRDAAVWEQLKNHVLPEMLASHPDGAVLRAWMPGCSAGEEAYSLAMIFKEALEVAKPAQSYSLQIFASDLDKNAIATGRAGKYPRSIAADVSEARLKRFFVEDAGSYRVCNEIREMVVFAEQNIIVDPPFTKIDLLSCRNLLIYLEAELQVKLIQLFHYSLNPGGFLVLGSAEWVGASTVLFSPVSGKSRIYRRLDAPARALPIDFPAAFGRTRSKWGAGAALELGESPPAPNLQSLVEKMVLQRYAPAAVLVTDQAEMLYFSGKTGKYLEPATGKPTLNLFAMAREGLSQALNEAFHRAIRERAEAVLKNVKVAGDRAAQYVDVVVHPLQEPAALQGMVLIVFNDVVTPHRRKSRVAADEMTAEGAHVEALMHELQQSRDEARSKREEMQTAQEELKSTNEELQSTNEELQSTIEELNTSKEEMQSMNEELQTKVAELSRASNDMKNLLESTEIATLFLDDALNVRRFTARTAQIIKLIPADTGRPVSDIVTALDYPDIASDAREVLRTLVFRERDVPTLDGRWFRVRTMPYRTQENRIDGLVITFLNITANKKMEEELRATQARCQTLMENPKAQGVGDGLL